MTRAIRLVALGIGLATAALAAGSWLARAAAPPVAAERAEAAERAGDAADALADRRTPVVRAAERAAPCVVNISTKAERIVRPYFWFDVPDVFRREFGEMFRPRRQVTGSLGSGILINPKGYIVTNAHVVQQADEIIVTLADESQHKAELVSADPEADLAIIKIEAGRPLSAIRLGTSSDLMIGETVIAVGNPFGYQHTVTTGVVSALDRTLEPSRDQRYTGLIQTDAPINPGNSGGPLLNIRAELIGINTAIRAGAQGLGFAIPVDKVREIMIGLLNLRRPGRPWLGLKYRTDTAGIAVAEVEKGSPADKAGLEAGDHIEAANGRPAPDVIEFETMLLDRKAGEVVRLAVRRGDRTLEKSAVLAEAPKPDGLALARARFGLHLQKLQADLTPAMRLAVDRGMLVAGVEKGGPADKAGFRAGDVVVQIDRYRVEDADTLGSLMAQVDPGDGILFYVVRGRTVARALLMAQ
ncbi:MAG: trypsin-like peptidase domain-containing protein [Planctomycetes bacterium]|nr:trypsin-like peptidase domain-containing protein [Planctomycetota bacterium]